MKRSLFFTALSFAVGSSFSLPALENGISVRRVKAHPPTTPGCRKRRSTFGNPSRITVTLYQTLYGCPLQTPAR